MKNREDAVRTVQLSRDFKNRAGKKAAVFFYAEDLIFFLILLPAVLLELQIQKAGPLAFWVIPVLPAGFLLFTLCRIKARRLWETILLTLLTAAVMAAILIAAQNYAAAALIVAGMIVSFVKTGSDFSQLYEEATDRTHTRKTTFYRKWQANSRDREDANFGVPVYLGPVTVIVAGILLYAVYLAAIGLDFNQLAVFCVVDFAAVFALMTVYLQKSGAYCLAQWDNLSKTENAADGRKAEKSGSSLFSALIAAIAVVGAGLLIPISAFFGGFQMDRAFLALLARIFNNQPPAGAHSEAPPNLKSPYGQMRDMFGKKTASHSQFGDIIRALLNVVAWCVVILAILFLVYTIATAVAKFYRKLNLGLNEESRSLLTVEDAAGTVRKHWKHISRIRDLFARGDNRSAIRRLFFVYVKKRLGTSVRVSDTPQEISGKTGGISDMGEAARIYEKARYSNNVCEPADVTEMRRALKPQSRQETAKSR